MRISALTRTAALLVGVSAAALWAPVPAVAAVPPDLQALEQQTSTLKASSERFDFQEEVSFGDLLGSIPFALIITGAGESTASPAASSVVGGLLGGHDIQSRTIGGSEYTYDPEAAEFDRRRPWVKKAAPEPKEAGSLVPGGLLENDQTGAQGTFSGLVEELNTALEVNQAGPVTVDDQRVTEFDAKLNPAPLIARLKSSSSKPSKPGSSLFAFPGVGESKPKAPPPPPSLTLEAFIAPNGLPVRVRATFIYEGLEIAVRVDTLQINVPVQVSAPPAKSTITEAKLLKIERRRAKRELAHALRACSRESGRRAARCRTLAQLSHRVPRRVAVSPV